MIRKNIKIFGLDLLEGMIINDYEFLWNKYEKWKYKKYKKYIKYKKLPKFIKLPKYYHQLKK